MKERKFIHKLGIKIIYGFVNFMTWIGKPIDIHVGSVCQ